MYNISQIPFESLRSQKEIIDTWIGTYNTPLVSISCITYNHEEYIENAIIGFLKQETDFPFEILINDDASTDNTPNIIKKYETLYPDIIKVCYHSENQYQKGFTASYFNLERAKGYYFAMCEGDDYWISKTHLKDAVMFLDNNKDVSIYGSACYIKKNNKISTYIPKSNRYNLKDYIFEAPFIPTCSLVVKTSIFKMIQNIKVLGGRYFAGDTRLKLISLTEGSFIVNSFPSVVYQKGTIGSWSNRVISQKIILLELLDNLAITREVGYLCDYNEVEALLKRVEREYLQKALRIEGLKGNVNWLKYILLHLQLLSIDNFRSSIATNPLIIKITKAKARVLS